MCKLEPAFVAIPDPFVVTLMLETLSKGVEYIEENPFGESVDYWVRRHLEIIVTTVAFEKISQDIWSE